MMGQSMLSDLAMAISMLLGIVALVWLASDYIANRGKKDYKPVAVAICLLAGLTMLDLPLALIIFKARPHSAVLLFILVLCLIAFAAAVRKLGKLRDEAKWRNPKVKLNLK